MLERGTRKFSKLLIRLVALLVWPISVVAYSEERPQPRAIIEWAIVANHYGSTPPMPWSKFASSEVCAALQELAICAEMDEWKALADLVHQKPIKLNNDRNSSRVICPVTSEERGQLRRTTRRRTDYCNNLVSSIDEIRRKSLGLNSGAWSSEPKLESSSPASTPSASYSPPSASSKRWTEETYNIDLLKIHTKARSFGCTNGSEVIMSLTGMIGPDSSFAVDRLLSRLPQCTDAQGKLVKQTVLRINSGGGFLKDGYELGRTLQKYQIRAVVEDGSVCASSCAVAFLGAADRVVEDKGQIMFHAPYFSGKNEYGEKDIDCDVGEESLAELKDYYISMTDKETGERLFERTMWYCSADDGWVVTGGAAAELYGIATER